MVTNDNLTLFEIRANRVSLEDILEELGGEITPELEEALRINKEQLAKKGESYILILEQLHAYVEFNKRYKEQAEANIKRATVTMERLKGNLLEAAKLYGKFEAGIHTVGTRKSVSVTITDEAALDSVYTTSKVTTTPNKTLIKEAIEAGLVVEGAELSQNLNLKIS